MEYDRALYRVYEHVMEDLNSSTPPNTRIRRLSSFNLQQQQQQQEDQHQAAVLPLFLPAICSPFVELLLNVIEQQQRGGRSGGGVCSVDFLYRVWRVCSVLIRGEEDTEEHEDENGVRQGGSNNGNMFMMRRLRRNGHHVRLATNDEDEEIGGAGSVNNGNGLRRRGTSSGSQSSQENNSQEEEDEYDSSDSEEPSGGSSSNSSAASSLSLSSASSSSSSNSQEGGGGETLPSENLPTSASLAQTVARTQSSRNRRRHPRRPRRRTTTRQSSSTTTPPAPYLSQNQRQPEGCTQKGLYNLMRFVFFLGAFHLVVLKCLHDTYVVSLMKKNRLVNKTLSTSRRILEENGENVATCIEYALSTRPVEDRGAYFHMFGDASSSDDSDDDDDEKSKNETLVPKKEEEDKKDPPLLGKDEILQIKILYGGECTGQCSRVHTVIPPNTNTANSSSSTTTTDRKLQSYITQEWSYTNPGLDHYLSKEEKEAKEKRNPLETEEYWKEPHYKFSTSEALLYLDSKTVLLHNVSVVNVTVTERCLSTGSDQGSASFKTKTSEIFSQIYGMDSAIINQLMYGIKTSDGEYRNGHVQSIETKERWSWNKDLLRGFDEGSFIVWFFVKIGDLALAILSFFLIMSVTALIVRVLTTSGVVVMFPLFACFRACGLPGADDRILNLSYSWIGRARNAIDRRGIHTSWHLIGAHMAKIFLYYIMYEACQAAWSVVLYSKSVPAAMPVWVYAFAMIWEYFSMVFVRSVLSVYFFPRIIFLYFTLFHLYFYSVPYGYYDVALIPLFLFSVQAMIYTLIALEAPAAARGAVSMECPREVYNRLSWPEWSASIPNEWTLFLPVNSRYTPLYDQEVEDEGNNGDDAAGQENGEESGTGDEDDDENGVNDDTPSTLSVPLGSEDVRTEDDNLVNRETDTLSESDPSSARSGLHARRGIAQH